MNIGVCVKVVADYELPADRFKLENGRIGGEYKEVIGLYDEHALEVAIQLKEKTGHKLYALSYGKESDISVLKKALSMGSDELVLIKSNGDDPFLTAYNLVKAIKKYDIDVVFVGRMSSDMEREAVGPIISAMLDFTYLPYVVSVDKNENDGNRLSCIQQLEDRNLTLDVKVPFVASVTDAPINLPRIPKLIDIMRSKSKPIHIEENEEYEFKWAEEVLVEIPKYEYVNEFLPNEDLKETAKILIDKLQKEHYL